MTGRLYWYWFSWNQVFLYWLNNGGKFVTESTVGINVARRGSVFSRLAVRIYVVQHFHWFFLHHTVRGLPVAVYVILAGVWYQIFRFLLVLFWKYRDARRRAGSALSNYCCSWNGFWFLFVFDILLLSAFQSAIAILWDLQPFFFV